MEQILDALVASSMKFILTVDCYSPYDEEQISEETAYLKQSSKKM